MQLVSYNNGSHDQLALLINGLLYNADELHPDLPGSIGMLLNYWEDAFPLAKRAEEGVKAGRFIQNRGIPVEDCLILSPVPFPASLRKGQAFRTHIAAVHRNLNLPFPEVFDAAPIISFCNHHSIQGPGEVFVMPDDLINTDFELAVAAVICKHGRNIPAAHADEYIGGLMIVNNIASRMAHTGTSTISSVTANGKTIATAAGPVLVTLDELESFEIPAKVNHTGRCWNLPMTCSINSVKVSEGNLGDMDWTFAELIESASYGADIYPGDIICSGAVGTGCFLELNGAPAFNNPGNELTWLKAGDHISMEVGQLGKLENQIVPDDNRWSILKNEK
ncbi:MAG: fumarylacetoacetate hydrolase family protein [Chitinophagaceae bacterium]|nr:fumarylacetoacetate hydrolase family protein [Chitinophagaceae bacterium]